MSRPFAATLSLVIGVSIGPAASAAEPPTILQPRGSNSVVSESIAGGAGDQDSRGPSITADGRLIAFTSRASDLVEGDTNGEDDIFIRDRTTDTITRVTYALDSGDPNQACLNTVIAADGRYVTFESRASNLVADPTNGEVQVYLYDRIEGTTRLITKNAKGEPANLESSRVAMDASGRYIVFQSRASNLVPGDKNRRTDVFLYDAVTDVTSLVSHAPDGSSANDHSAQPAISADGTLISFTSDASNLLPSDSAPFGTHSTAFGQIYLVTRDTGAIELVSRNLKGLPALGFSTGPTFSPDGLYLGFSSEADDIAARDRNGTYDAFVQNLETGVTRLVSRTPEGTSAERESYLEAVSNRARTVTFFSWATDLVSEADTNLSPDVFMRDRRTGISLVSETPGDEAGVGTSYQSVVDARGRVVVFASTSWDLLSHGTPADYSNVYLYRRP